MSKVLHRHRLQPHPAGTGECGEKDAVTTEKGVLDAGDRGDVELHGLLVHANVARVYAQRVACRQVVNDHLAVKLHPRLTLALEALHPETGSAEDAGAEPLLESDRELHADRCAHEAVPM